MSEIVIKTENLSKLYRLGVVGTGTISHDLNRWWARVRGKEDPFLKVGQENVRDQAAQSDYVWSLRDINFEVPEGEVMGIVGKNGAGKSTLLKILSRITSPTTGEIKIKGRIASLLEVGTGFHPELTGRENIYLNGAIMGMTKAEVKRKMDEIVDFSGVSAYVDTPVKRYSSGMTVRLGFAVAAHLEPEILIIDEVLAVGDAEFQKKCIGKMKDVANQGRTVLFVSHNMTAVNSLCKSCMYLKNGRIVSIGEASEIVNEYLSSENASMTEVTWSEKERPGDDVVTIHSARMIDSQYNNIDYVKMDEKFGIEYIYEVHKPGYKPNPNIHINTSKGELAFVGIEESHSGLSEVGLHKTTMWVPENLLNDGNYSVRLAVDSYNPFIVHAEAKDAMYFEVIENMNKRNHDFKRKIGGVVRPELQWESNIISYSNIVK
ncbi:ABC transporter ATP-binding protein [Fulvivirgaceae bacterium BMA10]|uniref:ABC transporter ATP-binding protein n=1 Tax=Splendidivirga corallicola TaxID=3051826 RepID=A0ABT8KQX5_9BACT|nr:ABC transporter ATP-binding protein [Fulvivirgaceae bacterium BMA10]